jgi:hypothetical protein
MADKAASQEKKRSSLDEDELLTPTPEKRDHHKIIKLPSRLLFKCPEDE